MRSPVLHTTLTLVLGEGKKNPAISPREMIPWSEIRRKVSKTVSLQHMHSLIRDQEDMKVNAANSKDLTLKSL